MNFVTVMRALSSGKSFPGLRMSRGSSNSAFRYGSFFALLIFLLRLPDLAFASWIPAPNIPTEGAGRLRDIMLSPNPKCFDWVIVIEVLKLDIVMHARLFQA